MPNLLKNGTKKEGNTMAKTKAELLNEYRDLKKENLKLHNQLEQWEAFGREENRRALKLAKQLDETNSELEDEILIVQGKNDEICKLSDALEACQKEKTLIQSQRDVLLKEAEEHLYQINDLKESFDILQAQVRKIQIDEGVIHDQGYEEGYMDAEHKFNQALSNRESEIEDLLDHCDIYWWILRQLHENANK